MKKVDYFKITPFSALQGIITVLDLFYEAFFSMKEFFPENLFSFT